MENNKRKEALHRLCKETIDYHGIENINTITKVEEHYVNQEAKSWGEVNCYIIYHDDKVFELERSKVFTIIQQRLERISKLKVHNNICFRYSKPYISFTVGHYNELIVSPDMQKHLNDLKL